VVSTNRGGPSETVLDGETGFLVEPGDEAGLARHVIDLLRDPDLRTRMGSSGRGRAERLFSAQVTAERFMEVLDKISKNRTE
jgi:glycosyltransferase involved in cell wall biosynthesis